MLRTAVRVACDHVGHHTRQLQTAGQGPSPGNDIEVPGDNDRDEMQAGTTLRALEAAGGGAGGTASWWEGTRLGVTPTVTAVGRPERVAQTKGPVRRWRQLCFVTGEGTGREAAVTPRGGRDEAPWADGSNSSTIPYGWLCAHCRSQGPSASSWLPASHISQEPSLSSLE